MKFGFVPHDFVPFFFQTGVRDPDRFALTMLVVTLAVFVAMVFVLVRDVSSPIRTRRLALALAVGAAIAFVAIPVLVWVIELNFFGFVQLAWNCLVFAVAPAAGYVLLRPSTRKRLSSRAASVAAAGLVIWPVALYARFIEPYRLRVERSIVELEPRGRTIPAIRIGVLADLQTDRITSYERHVVDLLMEASPDLILIPGDLFQGSERDFYAARDALNGLLRQLQAPLGVFFVAGDVDTMERLPSLFEGTSIRGIEERIVRLDFEGARIELAGLAMPRSRDATLRTVVDRWRENADPSAIRIAFAHHPDQIRLFGDGPTIDLFIAGHTHGGQISFPLLGPPVTLSSVPREVGAGGLHRLNGQAIYVSRGAGMERGQAPRMRFLCPPEVAILEIVAGDRSRVDR